ncbi:MAG: methyltransferase domain-containing protein [Chloroflexota bacterium]|nr:methyltransferase domain-containing protein [Chloroflexota bacterium]
MHRSLLDIVRCPTCSSGDWTLDAQETVTLAYADGPRDEVRTGLVRCVCGKQYPIQAYVLSFAGLFGPELAREAAFWDRYYLWNLAHGAVGFHDLTQGFAPFLAQGVTEAFPQADTIHRYAVHHQVAEHPLLRAGTTLLDIGVGLGWTALYFARAGYRVTAFDPSLGPLQAAKAYAIEQGVAIEYLCAAVGCLDFAPASFDNVTAFHALHHVPDAADGLAAIGRWLRPGGALALDEHIAHSPLAGALGARLYAWAAATVFPQYRTLTDSDLADLPVEPHSPLEDAGMAQLLPLLECQFTIEYAQTRHVVLDHYPLLYYLWQGKDPVAFQHGLTIANHLQALLCQADPAGGEYLTVVAANHAPAGGGQGSGVRGQSAIVSDDELGVAEANAELRKQNSELGRRVAELTAALAVQGTWARGLEATVGERDRELTRLRAHLRRVANGRVLRLLARLRGLWAVGRER